MLRERKLPGMTAVFLFREYPAEHGDAAWHRIRQQQYRPEQILLTTA